MALPDFAEALRAADPERHVSLLYAPAGKRPALAALYAFDQEIAGVRDRIREPMPGEIRLQWWRDALAAGQATGNPLADALIEAIRDHGLPLPAFENYLEARVFDLYDDPMASRNDLEGYLGETEGTVIQLAAVVLDPAAASASGAAAGHAGCARGIATLLRKLPLHRSRGQCFIPAEMLAAAGTTPGSLLADEGGKQAATATGAMAALGREHYAAFGQAAASLPPALRPAYLPLAAVPDHLKRLAASDHGRHEAPPEVPPWKLQWLMLRAGIGRWPKA